MMNELNLAEMLLDVLPVYGPYLLGLVALCCALGLPLPMPVLVLATGALVRQGMLGVGWAVVGCLAGSLLGESVYYTAGRYAGDWVQQHAGRLIAGTWLKTQQQFGAQAALTVYLTRFLFTPLGIPTSVIAGSHHYAFWRFAGCALAGDMVWIASYGAVGYLLGAQWQAFSETVLRYGNWVVSTVAIGLVLRYVWHKRTQLRRLWHARPATLQPAPMTID